MKNILGTVAKIGIAALVLRVLGYVIVVGLLIWIVGSLVT